MNDAIKNNKPQAWRYYEEGRSYNQRLYPNQYVLTETNTEFFIGNQWLRLPNTEAMQGLPKPTFNILKRVASLFIATLTSSGVTIHYDPLAYYDGSNQADPDHDAALFLNAEVSTLMEKLKLDYRIRDALYDGAVTGDYCAHFWFDPDAKPYGGAFSMHRGEIKMELVDGINVMFGNPSDFRVQTQPYIILVGRDTVDNLRWEAERFRKNKQLYKSGVSEKAGMSDLIQPDYENEYMPGVGGKVELTGEEVGKALYVVMYTKVQHEEPVLDSAGEPVYEDERDANGDIVYETDKDGFPVLDAFGAPVAKRKAVKHLVTTVYATKATRSAIIYENVDTGLSLYPVAWGNWEHQKNQYHGRALVSGLISNQIFINTMFATAMRHMQLQAFPKTVYNADMISSWSNEVGQTVAVHGLQPGQSVSQMAAPINPGDMSGQLFALIDKAMSYTKECLGTTDVQMGNVRPDNTSAIMVLNTNSQVPLENVRARLYEFVEDIGAILPDMIGTYYGKRPVVIDQEFEEPVMGPDGVPQIDPMTGMMKTQAMTRKVIEEFDFSQLKDIVLNMRIDVGATTYFSEVAITQTLDNLRRDGTLDVLQYLERIPDKLIPRKQDLINELRGRIAAGTQANAAAGAAIPEPGSPVSVPGVPQGGEPAQGGDLSPDKAQQGLPTPLRERFEDLPNIAKKTALAQGATLAQ